MFNRILLLLATPFLYAAGFRRYRRVGLVSVKRMNERFIAVSANGHILEGKPGDYLARPYRDNSFVTDEWVIDGNIFRKTYEFVDNVHPTGWTPARKRSTVLAKRLNKETVVATRENPAQRACPGDYLVIGTSLSDRWPISGSQFKKLYQRC